jgi:hypothetical protein
LISSPVPISILLRTASEREGRFLVAHLPRALGLGGGRVHRRRRWTSLPGLEGWPGRRRTGGGGGSMRAGRRGGRGRRWQAVRPAVAAGVERVSRAPAAILFFLLSGRRWCCSSFSLPCFRLSLVFLFRSNSYSNCRIFDRGHDRP